MTYELIERLGRDIILGKFDEQTLPGELVLAEAYETTPLRIREALDALSAKGMVSAHPARGAAVRAMYNWDTLDPDVLRWMLEQSDRLDLVGHVAELRGAVEPQAVALAATQASDAQHDAIMAAVERFGDGLLSDDHLLAAQIAFHLAILDAANNVFFAQLKATVAMALHVIARQALRPDKRVICQKEPPVAQAVLDGMPRAAEQSMSQLLMAECPLVDEVFLPAIEGSAGYFRTSARAV